MNDTPSGSTGSNGHDPDKNATGGAADEAAGDRTQETGQLNDGGGPCDCRRSFRGRQFHHRLHVRAADVPALARSLGAGEESV